MPVVSCPCGVGTSYEACCEPFIRGKPAPTAEALMRARYSAYARAEIDFILESLHPEAQKDADRATTEAWSRNAEWHGLEVLEIVGGGPEDEYGEVEFVAKFSIKGEQQRHHERAEFRKHAGKWTFRDGKQVQPTPTGSQLKIGRNDACPCGSTKKFKKCCSTTLSAGALTPEALVRARFTARRIGDWNFLWGSLHPEARQPKYDQSVEVSSFEVKKVTQDGDRATVEVAFSERTPGGESLSREIATLKQYQRRWLYVGAQS